MVTGFSDTIARLPSTIYSTLVTIILLGLCTNIKIKSPQPNRHKNIGQSLHVLHALELPNYFDNRAGY